MVTLCLHLLLLQVVPLSVPLRVCKANPSVYGAKPRFSISVGHTASANSRLWYQMVALRERVEYGKETAACRTAGLHDCL